MPSCPKRFNPNIQRNIGESNDDFLERVYGIFKQTMETVIEKYTYNGRAIRIADHGGKDKMRSFFEHIIHYDNEKKRFNDSRLKYAYALPQMLINCCNPSCSYCFQKPSNKNRFTVFCEAHGYVVVLIEKKDFYLVLTGIHIKPERYEKYK